MRYSVIKNVSLADYGLTPTGAMSKSKKFDFPWRSLELNDAFFVPNADVRPSTLSTYAFEMGRHLKRRFSVRTVEGGRLVIRIA